MKLGDSGWSVTAKNKAVIAHLCRALQRPITSIYVSLYLVVEKEMFQQWMERSKSFPELLRIMAREHFGDREDVSEIWEQGICQVITDISDKAMSKNEAKYRDISKPALIFEWFADYLERTFPRKEISWKSKLFANKAIHPLILEIENLQIKALG